MRIPPWAWLLPLLLPLLTLLPDPGEHLPCARMNEGMHDTPNMKWSDSPVGLKLTLTPACGTRE